MATVVEMHKAHETLIYKLAQNSSETTGSIRNMTYGQRLNLQQHVEEDIRTENERLSRGTKDKG